MFLLTLVSLALLIPTATTKNCRNQSSIAQSLADAHIPGTAIVVVNATDILYQQAFGYQTFSASRPINVTKSIFTLASVSKTFIAVAIMQLVELNLVDLDTDINHYLLSTDPRIFHPLYPSHAITLRQLLSHSASIDKNGEMPFASLKPGDSALTETALADRCFTYLNPNASNWLLQPPGTVSLYSNIGASLSALIVERVMQMPYERYVREKILNPLGIKIGEAGFRLSDIHNKEALVEHYAFNTSYLEEWRQQLPQLNVTQSSVSDWLHIPFFSIQDYPSGLMRMSAMSLSLFLRMFMNNGSSILHPRSIIEMRTSVDGVIPYQNPNSPSNQSPLPPFRYGLIWNWQTMPNGRQLVGHSGEMPGATNLMVTNENGTVGIIFLSNTDVMISNGSSMKFFDTLISILMSLFDCFEN
ncbi:unnamed protein product [Rotaria sp. Silwood2]|nr:unnamed protein product [Rotaria sp. Silwood2]CAF2650511.1 unnamed protein product [Rotaria sp. Silwood2]CAF4170746.1 unnamed protein product [Rotaria sp. Silwood2]